MALKDEDKQIVLICGNCGKKKEMSESAWLPWKEKRQKYGTVLTHDDTSCHGVYSPEDELRAIGFQIPEDET